MVFFTLGVKSHLGPSVTTASHNGLVLSAAQQEDGLEHPLLQSGEDSAPPQPFLKKLHLGEVRFVPYYHHCDFSLYLSLHASRQSPASLAPTFREINVLWHERQLLCSVSHNTF